MAPETDLAVKPDHVPHDFVMDFDCYRFAAASDLQDEWLKIKERAPNGILWTPRNGGHWVALAAKDIQAVYSDYRRFSSETIFIPPNGDAADKLLPQEMDPPRSYSYRRIVLPPLLPPAIEALEPQIRTLTAKLIEGFRKDGGCEFVRDFASRLPVEIFLGIMGLPQSDRDILLPLGEMSTRPESPEQRLEGHRLTCAYLQHWIDERRSKPGTDFLSRIVHAEVDGRPFTNSEALHTALTVLIGGLDTVANLLTFSVYFLALNPGHRRQLIERPELVRNAAEELLRRFGIVAIGRRVAMDTELSGAPLKSGDMIQGPTMLYGVDSDVVDDPLKVDFTRPAFPHLAFGEGAHVCPGQHLARRELRVFLEEWLSRIPEFELGEGNDLRIETGMVAGFAALNLRWPVN